MMKNNNILIIAALQNELNPVKNKIEKFQSKSLNLDFLITGLGREKTIKSLSDYIQIQKINMLINIGSCGSLNEKFNVGDIIFPLEFTAKNILNPQKIKFNIDKLNNIPNRYKTGRIYSSITPINSSEEKIMLRNEYKADIVDMESYWLAEFCKQHGIEFHSVKVVSDLAEGISISEFKMQMNKIAGNLIAPVKSILELAEVNGK